MHINFAFLIFNFSSVFAWNIPIEVSTQSDDKVKVYNKLVIGIESGATDGFDNLWDTPAMLSHPDPDSALLLRAYIKGDDNERLWKDIRGAKSKGETIWDVSVDSVSTGRSVLIRWDLSVSLLKSGERLALIDYGIINENGKPKEIDMSDTKNYTYVSSGDEMRYFSLVLSKEGGSSRSSGAGSGFGCGTIRPYSDSSSGNGTIITGIFILFSPVVLLRLLRLTRVKLFI